MKTIFHIDDRVTNGAGLSGTVVCVVTGVMVMTEEAGLIHDPDSAKLAVSNEATS